MLTIGIVLAIGLVLGVIGLVTWIRIVDAVNNRKHRAREARRQIQRDGERQLQQITQDALGEMLNIARRHR